MRDTDVLSLLPHNRFGAVKWGTDDLRWAIREMEREFWNMQGFLLFFVKKVPK